MVANDIAPTERRPLQHDLAELHRDFAHTFASRVLWPRDGEDVRPTGKLLMEVDRPSEVDDFDRLIDAWNHSRSMHTLRPGADETAIHTAGDRFGRHLPTALVRLLRFSDGVSIAGGNFTIESVAGIDGEDLVGMSERLRDWGWPIPDEVFAIRAASGGQEAPFGGSGLRLK